MHALQIFPCDTTTVERQSSGKQRLSGHYHSTLVTLISWWASSLHPPPSFLYFHISLSSSVSPHRLILSLWGADENRERETARNTEIERKQKMTRGRWKQTETDRRTQAGREKEERSCISLTFESLCNHWPLLVIAKRLWWGDTPWKCCSHPISLPRAPFIEFPQPSLLHLVCKHALLSLFFLFVDTFTVCSHLFLLPSLSLPYIDFYCSSQQPYSLTPTSTLPLPSFLHLLLHLMYSTTLLPNYIFSLSCPWWP